MTPHPITSGWRGPFLVGPGTVGAGVHDPLLGSRIATFAGPVSGHGDRGRSIPFQLYQTHSGLAAEHQQRSYPGTVAPESKKFNVPYVH